LPAGDAHAYTNTYGNADTRDPDTYADSHSYGNAKGDSTAATNAPSASVMVGE
jgi:hypothetical protein